MKTKNRNYLFSAILIGIAMLMTACAVERDNAVWNNPLGDNIPNRVSWAWPRLPTAAWCRL